MIKVDLSYLSGVGGGPLFLKTTQLGHKTLIFQFENLSNVISTPLFLKILGKLPREEKQQKKSFLNTAPMNHYCHHHNNCIEV